MGKICLKFRTLNCSIQCISLSEVMFDSEEDDRTDINEIVHEVLIIMIIVIIIIII